MMTFLYIVLFIVFLSILIVVHELGHLTAAKIFKVYCLEFSIGFGPAIIHHKDKGKETYFSLRCIPFGGYVSMYGEGVELPEGEDVPISRSLEGIRKWKQAIIMVAGVTMNALLALVIFFISNQACIHYTYYLRYVDKIQEGTIAYYAGVNSDTPIYCTQVLTANGGGTNLYEFCVNATITYSDSSVINNVGFALDTTAFTMDKRGYEDICAFYETYIPSKEGAVRTVDVSKPISLIKGDIYATSVSFTINNCQLKTDEKGNTTYDLETMEVHQFSNIGFDKAESTCKLKPLGLSMLRKDEWYSFPKAVKQTFVDFGNASVALFKGIGALFTADGWKNVGGIVAIGVSTTNTLTNQGIAAFLYYWGFISINLAIVNLLPFPGLDGWHLLVIAIEGISKKKIPLKVKNIVSLVGLGLLFTLMVLIIIKDIIMLV